MNSGLSAVLIVLTLHISVMFLEETMKSSSVSSGWEPAMVNNRMLEPGHADIFTIFPNPTTNNIKLKTDLNDTEVLRYELYDMTGMMIKKDKIEGPETLITMEHLAPSIYFLKVKREKSTLMMFKIIKN
jgi:hypothetical protein